MTDLNISEIAIEPIDNKNGLIGFTNFVVNGDLKICNVAIYSCPSSSTGIRLVFPQKEHNGVRLHTVYPIHKVSYEVINVAVASAYRDVMARLR